MRWRVLGVAAVLVAAVAAGAGAGVAVAAGAWTVRREVAGRRAARSEEAGRRAALAAVEAVALEMRCGAAVSVALGAAGDAARGAYGGRVVPAWVGEVAGDVGGPGHVGGAGLRLLVRGRRASGADVAGPRFQAPGGVDARLPVRGRHASARRAVPAASVAVPVAARALLAAVRFSTETGAGLADLCDAIAASARAEQAAVQELSDSLVGARSSADLLLALPLLGVLLGSAMGAHPARVLLHTAAGSACLALGTVLACAGRLWTGRIVRRARAAAG